MLTRTILALFLLLPSAAAPQTLDTAISALVRISGTREGAPVRGSGFVVSLDHDKATIVTASHVIQGIQHIEVTFAVDATKNFPVPTGGVLGMDADSPNGLAVFQVRGALPAGITPLSFEGESQPHPGEALILLEFPQMERTPRTTQRTLSGRRGTLLLIDQSGGEGSSGGPALQGGKVVGVVTSSDDQTTYAVSEPVAFEALEGWGVKLGSPVIDRAILPSVIHFCGANCATLVLTQGHYVFATRNLWEPPGFSSTWTVEAFTRDSVILHRHDSPNPSNPNGLNGWDVTYNAQISKEGNRLINISVNGSRKNNAQFAWGSALDSVPGSNEERDRARQTPDTVPGNDKEHARRLQLSQTEGPSGATSDIERDRAHELALRAQALAPRGPHETSPVWLPHWHGDPVVVACPNGPTSGSGIDGRSAWRKGKSAQIIEGDGPLGTNWGHDLEALDWYCKASAAGNPFAAYDIGQIFRAGLTVNTPGKSTNFPADPATAFYWFRLAADRGFTKAMLRVAQFYISGEVLDLKGSGVAKDPKQALFWVRRAADNGDSEAKLVLASAYLGFNNGWGSVLGIVPDEAKGIAFGTEWAVALIKASPTCADPDNRRSMIQLLPQEDVDGPVRGITAMAVHGSMEVECVVRLDGPSIRDDGPTLVQLLSLMHGGFVSSWRYYLTSPPGSTDFDVQRQTTIEAMAEGFESIAPLAKAVADAIDKHNKSVK